MANPGQYQGEQHPIFRELVTSGLSSETSWEKISDTTRDRPDVGAWRCTKSGVIILESTSHISDSHYTGKASFTYWNAADRKAALATTESDDRRRADFIRDKVRGKSYLDVGTGLGGILDLLRGDVARLDCVEIQLDSGKALEQAGYRVFRDLADVPDNSYQVISLFHVLEHIQKPIEFMQELRKKLTIDGIAYIEVPHAKDALLYRYQSEAFKKFTLWSEHLILHTKESLEASAKHAGFKVIETNGIQRYPLANHLYWLTHHKPGGHNVWSDLNDPELNKNYEQLLSKLGQTDTLLMVARKE